MTVIVMTMTIMIIIIIIMIIDNNSDNDNENIIMITILITTVVKLTIIVIINISTSHSNDTYFCGTSYKYKKNRQLSSARVFVWSQGALSAGDQVELPLTSNDVNRLCEPLVSVFAWAGILCYRHNGCHDGNITYEYYYSALSIFRGTSSPEKVGKDSP